MPTQPPEGREPPDGPARLRVLLVDDHAMVRRVLARALRRWYTVTEAADAAAALRAVRRAAPDVIVMDLGLPGVDGSEAARAILREAPEVRILGLSGQGCDEEAAVTMLRAGARGYVSKLNDFEDLKAAIGTVAAGEFYLKPALREPVRRWLAQGAPPGEQRITPRERDILARVAVGETVKESAAALGISPKTVEAHRQHLREKLELTSAAALTRFAVERTRDDGRRPAAADSPPSASGHPLGTHRR